MSISLATSGPASVITFEQPPFNLLDIDTMDELVAVHREADADPTTRVIVLQSGLEGMFCNGLNPMTVLEADRAGRVEIFQGVSRLVAGLYGLKKPHIAAINGPAMAGGAVLSILADFRYMDQDRGALCFAEAKVGVPVPEGLVEIIARVCHPPMLREVVMLGKNMNPQQALESGLVDGIAPASELQAMVEKQVARLARLSPAVMAATKHNLRGPVLAKAANMLGTNGAEHAFTDFVTDEYLGEGLKAFLEGRQPVFAK